MTVPIPVSGSRLAEHPGASCMSIVTLGMVQQRRLLGLCFLCCLLATRDP